MSDKDRAGDIAALRALKFDEDARTIPEMIEADEYEDVVVERVEPPTSGEHWTLCWDGGTCSGFKFSEGVEPKVGDTLRIYGGSRVGSTRHGYSLNGTLIEWQTPWERFSERVAWLAQHDRDKRERFERGREALDAQVDALPWPLRKRIERFRAAEPAFRIDSEAYEMAAAGDAPKIAEALAQERGWSLTDDLAAEAPVADIEQAVREFFDADYGQQKRRVPDLSEGHSGNTFAGAVRLAHGLLRGEEL